MTKEEYKIASMLTNKFPKFSQQWETYLAKEIQEPEDEEYESIYSIASEFSIFVVDAYLMTIVNEAFEEIEEIKESL